MEAVILIGLQGSGKSTFYCERYFATHVRINLDMLKTRRREQILLQACLEAGQPFVVDNTNPTRDVRRNYIAAARAAGFRVVGCYFQSKLKDCLERNRRRAGKAAIPTPGVIATSRRLELPRPDEGFDELFYVKLGRTGGFIVEKWVGDNIAQH